MTHPVDKGTRKLNVALTSMGLVLAGFLICAWMPGLIVIYPELCMAILAIQATFSGSNIIEKIKKPTPPV